MDLQVGVRPKQLNNLNRAGIDLSTFDAVLSLKLQASLRIGTIKESGPLVKRCISGQAAGGRPRFSTSTRMLGLENLPNLYKIPRVITKLARQERPRARYVNGRVVSHSFCFFPLAQGSSSKPATGTCFPAPRRPRLATSLITGLLRL